MMKTVEQHQSLRSCTLIFGFSQILYIGFHLARVSKIEKNRCMDSVPWFILEGGGK